MIRNRFAFALLFTAVPAFAQQEVGDIRYTIKDDSAYSVTVRVSPTGRVTVTQSRDNAKVQGPAPKYQPLEGRIDGRQAKALMATLRRGDQAIKTDPLPPTITGNFTLEWDEHVATGNRSRLGEEVAQYRLALEELEGIRDRILDKDAPQNNVMLDFGAVKRRYLPPFQGSPEVTEISVYMNGDVYLVYSAAHTEQTALGGVNESSGGANRGSRYIMTHGERRRLAAAWGSGVGPSSTNATRGQMRAEFVFEPVKSSTPGPNALEERVTIRTSTDLLAGNLQKVSYVLDEIAARIVSMSKQDEQADAETTTAQGEPQGGMGSALQQQE